MRLSPLTKSTYSNRHLGWHPGCHALDGMVNFPLFSSAPDINITQIQIIRGVHVPALRYRLFGIFSMSIATTMASVTHVILLVSQPGVIGAILGTVILVSSSGGTTP